LPKFCQLEGVYNTTTFCFLPSCNTTIFLMSEEIARGMVCFFHQKKHSYYKVTNSREIIFLLQIRLQIKRTVARHVIKLNFEDRNVDDVPDGYVSCDSYKDNRESILILRFGRQNYRIKLFYVNFKVVNIGFIAF
jgi:hypothetical protein